MPAGFTYSVINSTGTPNKENEMTDPVSDGPVPVVPREEYDEQVRLRNAHARQRDEATRNLSELRRGSKSMQNALESALARAEKAEAERDAVQNDLDWWDNWENEVAGHIHPSWDGDAAQIALLTNFIEHAARIDSVIQEAREASRYQFETLTFVWDEKTNTLSERLLRSRINVEGTR